LVKKNSQNFSIFTNTCRYQSSIGNREDPQNSGAYVFRFEEFFIFGEIFFIRPTLPELFPIENFEFSPVLKIIKNEKFQAATIIFGGRKKIKKI
jgi:hypothetical protein